MSSKQLWISCDKNFTITKGFVYYLSRRHIATMLKIGVSTIKIGIVKSFVKQTGQSLNVFKIVDCNF